MLKFDEGRTCDAIIRHLECRTEATRANVMLRETHPDPAAQPVVCLDEEGAI
jgi:hypothetical protein